MLQRAPLIPPPPPWPGASQEELEGYKRQMIQFREAKKARDGSDKWMGAFIITIMGLTFLSMATALVFAAWLTGGVRGAIGLFIATGLFWAAVVQVRKYL